MSVIWIVLPLALLFGGIAVAAFLISVRKGQMDDLDTPPVRMLFDDDPVQSNDNPSNHKKT